jgi:hypothetical protein
MSGGTFLATWLVIGLVAFFGLMWVMSMFLGAALESAS